MQGSLGGAASLGMLSTRPSRAANDKIVMGVMGRSAADMFFFGSTTNHVVRAARCPVLTTRATNGEGGA